MEDTARQSGQHDCTARFFCLTSPRACAGEFAGNSGLFEYLFIVNNHEVPHLEYLIQRTATVELRIRPAEKII